MTKYAEGTAVPVGRSRDEIERTLIRFGATAQGWMRDDEKGLVVIVFSRAKRSYRFTVPLPSTKEFETTPTGRYRGNVALVQEAQESEIRRRFRTLALYVKALLDASDTGIIRAEEALLPYLLLPTGETVYELARRELPESGRGNFVKALTGGAEARGHVD